MSGTMFRLLVASLCIAFLSAAPANETVTYENSSTSNPSDPHALSSVDIIVPHVGNTSAAQHMGPMETSDDHHKEEDFDAPSEAPSSESQNTTSLSPLTFDEEETHEAGPSTKATHIMVIPKKNVTMQSENDTNYSEEDYSASHEHHHPSKGSFISSTSFFVVLATVSWAVIIQ